LPPWVGFEGTEATPRGRRPTHAFELGSARSGMTAREQAARARRPDGFMRILLTSNRGAGHIGPLVPFAHAFADAGDDVWLAAPEGARLSVEREGLTLWPLDDPPEHEIEAVQADFPELSHDEQGVRMLRDVFAGIDVRASLPRMLRALAELRPDVVLS